MQALNLSLGIGNLICGLVFCALAMPLMKGRISRNDTYGMRFKKAMESEKNWQRINQAGGRHMRQWAIVIFAFGLACFVVPPLEGFWIWFFGLAPGLVGIGLWQTYNFAKRLK